MADPKKQKPGRPSSGRRVTTTVFARVDPQLGAALDAYLESLQPRSSVTAVVELALRKHLKDVGFWPPPSAD